MIQRTEVQQGMVVRSLDGEKLGKVFAVGETQFQIEKGLFFPKDYLVSYGDVQEIRDGEIILSRGRDSLRDIDQRETERIGATGTGLGVTGTRTDLGLEGRRAERDTERGDVRMELKEEQLDVVKRDRVAGAVQLKKDVVTEEKTVDVPVRKERVRVERRAVAPTPATGATFKDDTVVVPVHEEEVEVRKRAMVTGEVVVHKEAFEEQRRVADTVRKEEVAIGHDGDVEETSRRTGFTDELEDDSVRRAAPERLSDEPIRSAGLPLDPNKKI